MNVLQVGTPASPTGTPTDSDYMKRSSEEVEAMAAPTETPVLDANPYTPPAISGLIDLLDQHARDRPDARALVVTGDRYRSPMARSPPW